MTYQKANFRTKYFLKEGIQPQIYRRMVLTFGVIIVVVAVVFYLFLSHDLTNEYYSAHAKIKNTREIIIPILVVVNISALLLAAGFMLLPTHRIAGPIFHLQRDLKSIEEGKFPEKIAVRKNDTLIEFAESFDKAMRSVQNRIKTVRQDLVDLEKLVSELESSQYNDSDIRELKRKIDLSLSDIDFFQYGVKHPQPEKEEIPAMQS